MRGGNPPRADRDRQPVLSFRASVAAGLALAGLTALLLLTVSVLGANSVRARAGVAEPEPQVSLTILPPVLIDRIHIDPPVRISRVSANVEPVSQARATASRVAEARLDLAAIAEARSSWYLEQLAQDEPQAAEDERPAEDAIAAAPSSPPAALVASPPSAPDPTPQPTPVATPLATVTPAPVAPAPAPAASTALSARELGLLDAMNRERTANGLAPLQLNGTLMPIARARSEDMIVNGYFAHFSPTGESIYTLTADAGLRYSALGENLARVSGDAQRSVAVAIDKLMQSPPHRANILSAAYTHVAVGAVTDDRGVTVFTTVFASG